MYADDGPSQTCCLPTPQQASKRVCRNLTAEFCCSETSSSSEPNLDLWVLRTLGLKDRDTIDTNDSSSSNPSVSSSSVHSSCQRLDHQPDRRYGPADCHEASCGHPAKSPQNHTADFTATAPTGPIRSHDSLTDVQTLQLTEEPAFSRSPDCSSTTHPAYWSPSQDKILFSPPGLPFSPTLSSTPVLNQQWMSVSSGSPVTPRSRTDVAFSMSLSPSSSVKTHSFPQGQAFVRKDPEGTWHVTWVPRQGP